jgi:DNA polymerase III alpha subunit
MDSKISEMIPEWAADEKTGLEMVLRNIPFQNSVFNISEKYNYSANELDIPLINHWSGDVGNPETWIIPTEYQTLDIISWIIDKTPECPIRQERVAIELSMYIEKGLVPVLQLMLYLVETMRKNSIVWGVGRGSSVSSYVLYLIGVHHIDSVEYNLDINEFLR